MRNRMLLRTLVFSAVIGTAALLPSLVAAAPESFSAERVTVSSSKSPVSQPAAAATT